MSKFHVQYSSNTGTIMTTTVEADSFSFHNSNVTFFEGISSPLAFALAYFTNVSSVVKEGVEQANQQAPSDNSHVSQAARNTISNANHVFTTGLQPTNNWLREDELKALGLLPASERPAAAAKLKSGKVD